MNKVQIDIVSDIACPWCAIGYARLERAMAQLGPDYEFAVQWHAFELNPSHSGQGESILPALAKKYGRSEGEQNVLLSCVEILGLDPAKAKQVLESDQYTAEVREDEATYQKAGVTSVPAFIINNKYLISGAQEPDSFVQALREISAEAA